MTTIHSTWPAHVIILEAIRVICEKAVAGMGREYEIRSEGAVDALVSILREIPIPSENIPSVIAELEKYKKLGTISTAVPGSYPNHLGAILANTITAISSKQPEPVI